MARRRTPPEGGGPPEGPSAPLEEVSPLRRRPRWGKKPPDAIPGIWATPTPPAYARRANRTAPLGGIGLIRSRSSLLAESRLISFSRPTEIFHFGAVLIELGFGVFTLGEPSALRVTPVPTFVSWFIRPF